MANQLIPAGANSMTLANDANVSDEIATAGLGLGELVKRTGEAIAATQDQLNETGARTASALSQTMVDLIAVEERVYLDDGTLDTVQTHTRQLPLINFIDPVFYQWTNVRLQGRFTAREFSASSESERYSGSNRSGSGQSGLLVVLGGGYNSYQYSSTSVESSSQVDTDISLGHMRMNTLLQPREDVGVPKPNQAIQGPRLSLIQGEIIDVINAGIIEARTMSIMLQYNRRDGTAIAGKAISIETDGVAWSFVGDTTTDTSGQVEILLRREFLGEEPDRAPIDVVVSGRIGLVQNSVSVTL